MLRSNYEAVIWEDMLDRYGIEGMARRIARSQAYKEYRKEYPTELHYGRVEVVSLDVMLDAGYELPDEQMELVDNLISAEAVREYLDTLTPKQQDVVLQFLAGHSTREVSEAGNYHSTGKSAYSGVRHLRSAARRKWKRFND